MVRVGTGRRLVRLLYEAAGGIYFSCCRKREFTYTMIWRMMKNNAFWELPDPYTTQDILFRTADKISSVSRTAKSTSLLSRWVTDCALFELKVLCKHKVANSFSSTVLTSYFSFVFCPTQRFGPRHSEKPCNRRHSRRGLTFDHDSAATFAENLVFKHRKLA